MATSHRYFATAPKGMEQALADELTGLGAGRVELKSAGVAFEGPLAIGYRACLWSRVASRVLLNLASFEAPTAEALYEGARRVDWREHLRGDGTLAVDFSARASGIAHTHFGALKVKDAIVDQFREANGTRPGVDLERPDLRVNACLFKDVATLSVDLSGESLHRRGYRVQSAIAPLKENLAAAILAIAGWSDLARQGGGLVDPMCGSGTLPIEAGLVAADVAPGLLRASMGLMRWRQHDASLWSELVAEAQERDRRRSGDFKVCVEGFDMDAAAIRAARANARRAGLGEHLRFEQRELSSSERPVAIERGVLVANPPYGERLGDIRALGRLYRRLGDVLKQRFSGWTGFVLTGNLELTKEVGLRARRRHVLFNGAIECRLLEIPIDAPAPLPTTVSEAMSANASIAGSQQAPGVDPTARDKGEAPAIRVSEAAQGFVNRLTKNFRHLSKWARREGVSCFRVYDADLPDYALAIDLYERWVHVQEYAPPKTIEPRKAERRLQEALAAIPRVLGVLPSDVHLKVRQRQKGHGQYDKFSDEGAFHEVREGGLRFLVNLTDYLDTGLFLDHRPLRLRLGREAKGKRFLNLFGYTGAATVHAAAGGATQTLTVDLSNTYLDWARRNLALNGFASASLSTDGRPGTSFNRPPPRGAPKTAPLATGTRHALLRVDVLRWLNEAATRRPRERFDLIFLDPPTFSKSKAMNGTFDVQRDHPTLLARALDLLAPGGTLYFSTNLRGFRLDESACQALFPQGVSSSDITRQTLDLDFQKNPKIHRAWRFQKNG